MQEKIKMTTPEAAEYYRVCSATLRAWHKKGQIEVERNPSGHRRYIRYEGVPDAPEVEEPTAQEKAASQDARRKEIIAEIAKLEEDLNSDNSLLADYAKYQILPLEQELENLCTKN